MFQTCHHIMPGGLHCQSPAMRGYAFCYHHARRAPAQKAHKGKSAEMRIQLPATLDGNGTTQALRQVISALANNQISVRRASILLYGLQMAGTHPEQPSSAPPSMDPAQLAAEITAMLGQRAKSQ